MEIAVVTLAGAAVQRHKPRVSGRFVQLLLRHATEQLDGIVIRFFPEARIEPPEQGPNGVVPAPDQVICEFGEATQGSRKSRAYQEFSKRLNLIRHAEQNLSC